MKDMEKAFFLENLCEMLSASSFALPEVANLSERASREVSQKLSSCPSC